MSKNFNDCKNNEVIEGKNKYTCSTMEDKDKRGEILSNQIKNDYRLRKRNFNCKYFKNIVCFNKLCKQPVIPVQTNAIDISKVILYQKNINNRLQFLNTIKYASTVSKLINTSYKQDCRESVWDRNHTISKETHKTEGAYSKSTDNDINITSNPNSKEIRTEDKIKDFECCLDSYCGSGPKEKKRTETTSESSLNKIKPAFTDICVIDSLINLFMSTNIEKMKTHIFHKDHKERCAICILRSAICKTKLDKGLKKSVSLPEIKYNLNIFLGTYHCVDCLQQFNNKEEEMEHMEENNHEKKQLSFKKTLDTLLIEINIVDEIHLAVMCTECERDLNTSKSGYIVLPKGETSIAK